MNILIDVMNYLLKIIEAELVAATPELIAYLEKEMLLLIDKIKDIMDSKIK